MTAMRDMPFQSEAVPASLQFTSVKAFCNVTFVGAVFASALSTDTENLPAMTASYQLSVPMVDQFWMGVPPFGSADIRAEYFWLPPRSANQRCATVLTNLVHTVTVPGSNYPAQGISLAVGFYGVHGQSR